MRVSSFFLFAAIATETVSAQGIFRGRNDDNRVRALVEEVSMSADLSLSFSFGGIDGAEIAGAGIGKAGKSSPTPTEPPTSKPTRSPVIAGIGKAGKSSPTPTKPPTSKPTRSPVIGKSGKSVAPTTPLPTSRPSPMP